MLSIELFHTFINNKNDITLNLFTIYNNFNILINCKVFITYKNTFINFEPIINICNKNICYYCINYQDNINDLCDCNISYTKFDLYINNFEIKLLDKENNDLLYNTINTLLTNDLSNKLLDVINCIKQCDLCYDIIYTTSDLCNNCLWQKNYNIKYGIKLDNQCCICKEDLYLPDSVNICGNTNHSIHNRCKKDLKKCPLCRQT